MNAEIVAVRTFRSDQRINESGEKRNAIACLHSGTSKLLSCEKKLECLSNLKNYRLSDRESMISRLNRMVLTQESIKRNKRSSVKKMR